MPSKTTTGNNNNNNNFEQQHFGSMLSITKKPKKASKMCTRMDQSSTIGRGVSVRESTIPNSGLGLFADKDFLVGDFITEYCGKKINREQAMLLRKEKLDTHVRCTACQHEYIDGRSLLPEEGVGAASFANDGRDTQVNNSKFMNVWDSRKACTRVFLCVTSPIKQGDEIFVSYGNTYWDDK